MANSAPLHLQRISLVFLVVVVVVVVVVFCLSLTLKIGKQRSSSQKVNTKKPFMIAGQ